MPSQSKIAAGELLSPRDKAIIAEAAVRVTKVEEYHYSRFQVLMTIDGYHPELDGMVCILELPTITGEVYLSMAGFQDGYENHFGITLMGRTWQDMDWFSSL